jgi:hypothetical protein
MKRFCRADIPVCRFRRLSSRRDALAGLESPANRACPWSLDILSAEGATPKAIPKGLYRSAQGCAPSATLGARERAIYPEGGFSPALAYDYLGV